MNKATHAWCDLESTGLNVGKDYILELAMVATDRDMNIIDEISFVINPGIDIDVAMNDYVKEMHTNSGLRAEVVKGWSLATVEGAACDFMLKHFGGLKPPMCGAGVHFDRAFIKNDMPSLHDLFHYRNIDTSSIAALFDNELGLWAEITNNNPHRAMPDTKMGIDIYKFYKEVLTYLPPSAVQGIKERRIKNV